MFWPFAIFSALSINLLIGFTTDLEQEKKEEKLPKLEPRTEPKKEESRREFKEKKPLYQGEKKKEDKNVYGSDLDKGIKNSNTNDSNNISICRHVLIWRML